MFLPVGILAYAVIPFIDPLGVKTESHYFYNESLYSIHPQH